MQLSLQTQYNSQFLQFAEPHAPPPRITNAAPFVMPARFQYRVLFVPMMRPEAAKETTHEA